MNSKGTARRTLCWGALACATVALGLGSPIASGNSGIVHDDKNDGPANDDFEIDLAQHMHQSETRLEHTVYVLGEAKVRNPPNIYFETTGDDKADYKFRRADGRAEIVRPNGTRSRSAEVKKIDGVGGRGLSIRFQEGAIRTPSSYRWYVAYERHGEVLDRAHDTNWTFHDLEVHD